MTPFMQDSCESYKSFPQKLCKIVTSLAQKTRSCKILVRFQNYKQLSRARITHIATSCAKFLQDLQESCTKTDWTFLGRQLQDIYWDLNLRALKKFSARKIFICCRSYVYMQLAILYISAVQSRNGSGQTCPVTQPGIVLYAFAYLNYAGIINAGLFTAVFLLSLLASHIANVMQQHACRFTRCMKFILRSQ